ncbi:hypothetical protein [Methylobacterium nodulans]|uniref:Uncharacterized protein n=1 Tax=Methylobacterium nodulans (strain LMG 21967 / CNCM I-2342 / ORS 2060) TaxID=460265 RepID=B8IAJ9_METNO|nr:hypothetical protein [Methylobacterium nodulans]ACL61044.1 hypothetical protein Mnod_6238 [Methylobacterium nodulans ORS 2060]
MADSSESGSSKTAKAAAPKPDVVAEPSVRLQRPVEGSDQPVVIIVPEDQVDAYLKDGWKRESSKS